MNEIKIGDRIVFIKDDERATKGERATVVGIEKKPYYIRVEVHLDCEPKPYVTSLFIHNGYSSKFEVYSRSD